MPKLSLIKSNSKIGWSPWIFGAAGPLLRPAFLALVLVFTACNKEDKPSASDPHEVASEEGITALVEVLERNKLLPKFKEAGPPDARDYIATSYNSEGRLQMTLNIAENGALLPSVAWREGNPNFCSDQDQYLRSPKKRLIYTVHKLADGYLVFARYVDLVTGEIEEQREGEAQDLAPAIEKALQGINSPVQQAASPCGDNRDLRLVFRSSTLLEGAGVLRMEDQVFAQASLRPIDSSSRLEGSSVLQWKQHQISSTAANYQCSTPPDALMKVTELRTGGASLPLDSLQLHLQFKNWSQSNCTITVNSNSVTDSTTPGFPSVWQIIHNGDHHQTIIRDPSRGILTNESIYEFDQWKPVPDSSLIIARMEWERSINKPDGQYQEKTTITLRH